MQESGRRWGDAATAVQKLDAQAVLDQASPTPYHFLTRARGYSKTADIAGIGIAALLEQLPPGEAPRRRRPTRTRASSWSMPSMGLSTETRLWQRCSRSTLRGSRRERPRRRWRSSQRTLPERGASFRTCSSWTSGHSGRHARVRAAVEGDVERLPKVPGSRLVVLTTGGAPTHPAGLIERAKADPRWYVNEVPGPLPWANPDDLAEQRDELTDWEYRRLHLNEWVGAADHLANLDDVRACTPSRLARRSGRRRYVIGVDLGLTNDRAVCAVATSSRSRRTGPATSARTVAAWSFSTEWKCGATGGTP